VRNGIPTPQAVALVHVLCSAEVYGLRSADYLDCSRFEPALREPAGTQFDGDLTMAAVRFLTHIHFGRIDPRQAGFDLGFERTAIPYNQVLTALSTADDIGPVIARLEPQFLHYKLLKQALTRYRLLAAGQAVATRTAAR